MSPLDFPPAFPVFPAHPIGSSMHLNNPANSGYGARQSSPAQAFSAIVQPTRASTPSTTHGPPTPDTPAKSLPPIASRRPDARPTSTPTSTSFRNRKSIA
eukprot:TRINITY_DN9391_c0_g1_i3.p1 TRINITY_DN9391_c0_g1~~TRINITY_DN9391_c0_g1_i3.p1  ORF type:complete len:100 (+),score=15.68 TRINITY_DN9391_c0_g1_i3:111-410(+)